jgi:hypothetical protein
LDSASLYLSPYGFCVTSTGIYFAGAMDPAARKVPLKLHRFSDGKIVNLGYFDKPPSVHISVSPDEKWLLYTQADHSLNDLMLVENFR